MSKCLRNFDCSCTINFVIRNIFTNYSSLVTIEKCFNCSVTTKEKKHTISVKLPTENLDFLYDALLSSMFLQGLITCQSYKNWQH